MVALVVFPIMATSLGTIPNRCLSVTNLSTSWSCGPKSHRPRRPAFPARLPNFRPPVDLLAYIDAIPPPHAADPDGDWAADHRWRLLGVEGMDEAADGLGRNATA